MRSTRTWLWVLGLAALVYFAFRTFRSDQIEDHSFSADEGYGTSLTYDVAYETSFLIEVGLVWLVSLLIAGYVGYRLARRR